MKKLLVFTVFCLILAGCAPAGTSQYLLLGRSAPISGITAPLDGTPTAVPNGTLPAAPTATLIPTAAPAAQSVLPNFDHIILIMLENRGFKSVFGADTTQMPFLNTLATGNVVLTNYFAVAHPSLPNYIALMSGSTQKITQDCTDCFVNQPNLADEIEASGRTWKAYLEGMPSACFVGNAGAYAQKHDPLLYFDSIRLNAARCDRSIVPLTTLNGDLANNQLPNFSLITPNLCDSGHDCSAATADQWINDMVTKLQASPALGENYLIIIAFDEAGSNDKSSCCGLPTAAGGQVAVVLISPSALPDMSDNTSYDHYSLLKTILTAWNLPLLGQTALPSTLAITSPWTGLPGK